MLLHPAEHRQRPVGVGHHGALGEFQPQQGRRQSAVGERGPHVPDERLVQQAVGGNVDGHDQRSAGRPPPCGLADGQAQQVVGERDLQSAVLGDGQERSGQQQPEAGVPPAHECLRGGDRAVGQPHLGLEEQHQLGLRVTGVEQGPQVAEEGHPVGPVGVDVRVVHRHALAAGLRPVHRGVGVAQEVLGAPAVRSQDHPDAAADRRRAGRQDVVAAQRRRRPLGDVPRRPG